MKSYNKKVFQTEQLNHIRAKEKRSFLIFLSIMAVLAIWTGPSAFFQMKQQWNAAGILYFLLLDFLCALLIGMVPFYFYRARLKGEHDAALENCTFITIRDLDYYRDKLTGLHPTEISLLTDLKIDADKDISACLLLYTELGILKEENGTYKKCTVSSKKTARLKKSDLFLIDCLVSKTLPENIEKWKSIAVQEARSDGYITDKYWINATTGWKIKLIICIWFILFILAVMPTMGMSLFGYYAAEPAPLPGIFLNIGSRISSAMSILEQMKYAGYSEAALYFSSNPDRLADILLLVLYLAAAVLVIILPILCIKAQQARITGRIPLKRTTLGDEYSELIYGMKNFIHDYSNLGEADQDALVLWDDYLIYAVVLEENKQIVNEITDRKRRKL